MTNDKDSFEDWKASTRSDDKVRRLTPHQLDVPTASDVREENGITRLETLEEVLEEKEYSASTQVAVATFEDEYATAVPLDRGKSDPIHAVELAVWKGYSESRTFVTDILISSQDSEFNLCGRCYQAILDFALDPQVRVLRADREEPEDYTSVEHLLPRVDLQESEGGLDDGTSTENDQSPSVDRCSSEEDSTPVEDHSPDSEDLDVEYVRFDSPIYHKKYKKLSRTFCGHQIQDEEYRAADEEPILLDPCQSCFGGPPVKTIEEQQRELRKQISEQVIDIQPSRASPDEFSETEMRALFEAIPTTFPEFEPVPEKIRFHLSRAVENIDNPQSDYRKFAREELEALVNALDETGIISNEPHLIQLDEHNRIKRVPVVDIPTQHRGGKGRVVSSKDDSAIREIFVVNPRDQLLLFTNLGKVFQIQAHGIPATKKKETGTKISNLIDSDQNEEVLTCLSMTTLEEHEYILTISKDGYVKRTSVSEFENILSTGIIAVEFKEDDELCSVEWTNGEQDIFVATAGGRCIRFYEEEVRAMGRTARGAQGIDLRNGDEAVGVAVVDHNAEASGTILTTTANGYGKRTPVDEYTVQARNGMGLVDIITDERNGPVVDLEHTDEDSSVIIQTKQGQLIRISSSEISIVQRNTKGVDLIDIDNPNQVVSIAIC